MLTHRGYNWELAAQVQHQLVPRVAVGGGYFRRWFGNMRVTDNLSVTPADYSPYCVTAPSDARLPDGGSYQVCGLLRRQPPGAAEQRDLAGVEVRERAGSCTTAST